MKEHLRVLNSSNGDKTVSNMLLKNIKCNKKPIIILQMFT